MAVDWNYFNKFDELSDKYLPDEGEGETKATQIVTAVSKLVYKWYNDGDVFDNTYYLSGWCNDLSTYANWLAKYTSKAGTILDKVSKCVNDGDYEDLLKELADSLLEEEYLSQQNDFKKTDSIYECAGKFEFVEDDEEDEDW